jgi:hypothetical protein
MLLQGFLCAGEVRYGMFNALCRIGMVMGDGPRSVVMMLHGAMGKFVFWQFLSFRRAVPLFKASLAQDFRVRVHVTLLGKAFEWHYTKRSRTIDTCATPAVAADPVTFGVQVIAAAPVEEKMDVCNVDAVMVPPEVAGR